MKRENFGCNYLERGFQNEEKQGSPISSDSSDFRSCLCRICKLLFFIAMPTDGDSAEAIGGMLAGALVTPHIVVVCIAVVMNALGFFMYHRGFILAGAILYVVAIALMPIYFMFTLLQGILLFIAFAKMKKKE